MIIGFDKVTREPSKKTGAPGRCDRVPRFVCWCKATWHLCGGWRLSGGESWRVSRLLRLEAGVAPDDLDDVAEHKDEGHAADEVAYEGKTREGACDHAAHSRHGVAVLAVSDHARDRAPRKGARHQCDANNTAQEGSGKRETSDRDNQQ